MHGYDYLEEYYNKSYSIDDDWREYLVEVMNAESELMFKGQHGQMLDIQTKEEDRDPDVNSMARYSCDKGNKAFTELDDKSVHSFGYKQAGTVTVFLPDKIGEVQENKNPELFPEDYGQKVMEEACNLSILNR